MSLLNWLRDRRGDLVWSTLVIVTVLLPLGGLSLDVPRYFLLRSNLATAADAAAAAAAQCVDIPHFQNSGETRLLPDCALAEARDEFAASLHNLDPATYHPHFVSLSIDEGRDEVVVRAAGDLRLIATAEAIARNAVSLNSWRSLSICHNFENFNSNMTIYG